MMDWEAEEMAAWEIEVALIEAEEAAREQYKADMRREYQAPDTRTALQKALDADDSPEYEVPAQRRKAQRYARAVEGESPVDTGWERVIRCSCAGCAGRTWKRFRATQYRVRAVS